jgi:DNA polymerase elongation subunit (family B)
MKKLSLITAESTTVKQDANEYPCVVLIGRDSKGNKYKYRTKFYPYCYIHEEDYIKLLDEGFNFDKYVREAIGTNKRTITKRALTKLYFKDRDAPKAFIKLMRKHLKEGIKDRIYTYEADMSNKSMLALRYLIDKGIRSGFTIDSKGEVQAADADSNLRVWFIDLEVYSTKMCGHGAKQNEPIIMCSIFDNYEDKLYTLYVTNPKWKENKVQFTYQETDKHLTKGFDAEAKLLDYLIDMIREKDPDMIAGWNSDRYDIVQLKYRMDANKGKCLYDFKSISPFKSVNFNSRPYRIKGRILFDLMKAMKKYTAGELRSYSLASIAKYEKLDIDKVPFKGTTANTWDNHPEIMYKRNVNDVLILKALNEKHELIETFDDLRVEFGCLFHEVLMNYRVLDTVLLRYINKKYVLRTASKGKNEGRFLGAIVAKPQIGLHSYILQLDFSREYPNIMKLFNISPETYRKLEYKGECYTIEYIGNVYKFVKKPIGLLPQLISFFFKKRDEYEVEYKKAIEQNDKVKMKMWWRRIFNVKGLTNAIYGVMDYPAFRLHKKECSQAVAVVGRISIEYLQDLTKELGYEFIYCDTDSIFIKLKSDKKEDCLLEAKEIESKLNEGLEKYFVEKFNVAKAPSDLEAQKIYSKFLLLSRKNYAGKYLYDSKEGFKEGFDLKGFEPIRSDSSDLEKNTLETLVKKLLNGESKEGLFNYIESIYNVLNNKQFEPIELAYPLQISKPFRNYFIQRKDGREASVPSHIRSALYSNCYLNTDFEYGDKPRRLPIKVAEKRKLKNGQITLFTEDETYPNAWKYKDVEWRLRDISITEEMEISKFFIDRIDWQRIYNRLEKKISKIMRLVGGLEL